MYQCKNELLSQNDDFLPRLKSLPTCPRLITIALQEITHDTILNAYISEPALSLSQKLSPSQDLKLIHWNSCSRHFCPTFNKDSCYNGLVEISSKFFAQYDSNSAKFLCVPISARIGDSMKWFLTCLEVVIRSITWEGQLWFLKKFNWWTLLPVP